MNIWLNFLIDSLAFGATFIYGSTGEILTEKAGHLNLGIPGIMCMGGAGGVMMLNLIGKSSLPPVLIVVLGILSALLMSGLMGLIYSFMTVTLRANQNVTGLALTTFGVGLMKVIMSKMNATVYLVGPKMLYRWPFAYRQDSLQCLGVLFFLAIVVAIAASWVLFRTKVGLHLRAVGENPATAAAVVIRTACWAESRGVKNTLKYTPLPAGETKVRPMRPRPAFWLEATTARQGPSPSPLAAFSSWAMRLR